MTCPRDWSWHWAAAAWPPPHSSPPVRYPRYIVCSLGTDIIGCYQWKILHRTKLYLQTKTNFIESTYKIAALKNSIKLVIRIIARVLKLHIFLGVRGYCPSWSYPRRDCYLTLLEFPNYSIFHKRVLEFLQVFNQVDVLCCYNSRAQWGVSAPVRYRLASSHTMI